MGTSERIYDRGTRQGERWLRLLGEDLRTARLSLGLSQLTVSQVARISRPVYGRIERGRLRHVPLLLVAQVAAALGLELSARVYPGGSPIRDAAHAERLRRLLGHVGPPLRSRTEVPLPQATEHPERRAWDAMLSGRGEQTAIEFEMRLYDVQAQTRRLFQKQRDGAPDHLLLVVADTRSNRRVLKEFADLFSDLPRISTAEVLAGLRDGRHPPTGLILF